MVIALNSGAGGPGSSPDWEHYVVLLHCTLCLSLHRRCRNEYWEM